MMKAKDIENFIIETLKIEVKKTFDAKGNDNGKQYIEGLGNENKSLFPLRLEDFSIDISFKLPEDMHVGGYGFNTEKNFLSCTSRKKTPMTLEEAKLFEELKGN
jgi:hypothetical protein